jgi:hypothetical protein
MALKSKLGLHLARPTPSLQVRNIEHSQSFEGPHKRSECHWTMHSPMEHAAARRRERWSTGRTVQSGRVPCRETDVLIARLSRRRSDTVASFSEHIVLAGRSFRWRWWSRPSAAPGTVARRRCSPSPPWHLRGQEPRGFPDPRLVVLTYRALHDLPGASLRSEAFCQGVAFKQDLTTQGFPTPGPAHIVIGGWRGWPIVRPERPDGKGGLNICENSKVRNVYNRFV